MLPVLELIQIVIHFFKPPASDSCQQSVDDSVVLERQIGIVENMNKTQQLIVFFGLILVAAMGAYPPWMYVDDEKVAHPMGYAPIWKPPVVVQRDSANILGFKLQLDVQTQAANNIDMYRLLMQIAILSAVTGGAVLLLRRTPALAAV